MINSREICQEDQRLIIFNLLMKQEILTSDEYDFCKAFDPIKAENLFYNSWNNTYLNLNVYSEVDKEEYDLKKEIGY